MVHRPEGSRPWAMEAVGLSVFALVAVACAGRASDLANVSSTTAPASTISSETSAGEGRANNSTVVTSDDAVSTDDQVNGGTSLGSTTSTDESETTTTNADDGVATTTAVDAGPSPTEPLPEPCWLDEPGDAAIASARVSDAPDDLTNVLARVSHTASFVYGDLAYEGNNADVRGEADADGMYDVSGAAVAARWREMARQVDGLFVLRDSLWSQQDHPYRHAESCALILPPNWITAAAALESPRRVNAPPIEDDIAWSELEGDQAALFGTFPSSEALHEVATRMPTSGAERFATTNARRTLRTMADMAGRLLAERLTDGPEAAIRLGAEMIARGDIAYFGEELRRSTVIPILVPNVGPKEIEEGKGFAVPGADIADDMLRDIEHTVFERRLRDGDIALERYDLTKPADRRLAVSMLEQLIPEDGADGPTVWLWINGRLDPDLKLRGEDPTAYIDDFRTELEAAAINMGRLDFVSKPVVEVTSRSELAAKAERYADLGLPLSVTLTPAGIAALDE